MASATTHSLVSTSTPPRHATVAAQNALLVLLLTSVHHVYGGYVYGTPWRYHVVAVAVPAALAIAWTHARLRAAAANVWARRVFVWTTLLVPILLIGAFEGLYNHVAKDALYFAGASGDLMSRLFPPPTYEMPNDVVFEVTGVLQAVPAAIATWYLWRFVRAGDQTSA